MHARPIKNKTSRHYFLCLVRITYSNHIYLNMNTTEKLLHYFHKLSEKKQAEIVDFVAYLYEREQQKAPDPVREPTSQVLEKSSR
ncbi:MAG: hypothetical protein D6730_12320 [Bacteroidetes bacterium]|nr:MAG: hypothetical protein D6730_12320 [Bacteroidota bacterium]